MKFVKWFTVSVILSLSLINVKAQSTVAAFANATIVNPLTVSTEEYPVLETLINRTSVISGLFKSEGVSISNKFLNPLFLTNTLTAADLTINGGVGDVYTVTMPGSIILKNIYRPEAITANLYPENVSQQEVLKSGQQHIKIKAGIDIGSAQTSGRYASQAFDVTVNFN